VNVEWRALARGDLIRHVRYLAAENPIAAARIARELLLAAESLRLFPNRGRPGGTLGTRELVGVRPYVLVYRVRGETVEIVRVWHAAQNRP
jgi:plasmid stabilization system protein ParE